MKPFLKYGLIAGLVGLIVIVPVATFMGICGPGVTLAAAAAAGFLTAYGGRALTRTEGAQSGAMAGAVTGVVTLFGQLAGVVIILVFVQVTQVPTLFGSIPTLDSPTWKHVLYYGSGLVTGLCFGILGILLSGAAGAAAGAPGTRERARADVVTGAGQAGQGSA